MGSTYTMTIGGSSVNVIQGTFDVVNEIGQRSTGSVQVWSALGVKWSYGTAVAAYDASSNLVFSGYTSKDKVTKASRQGTGYLEHQITLMDNCYRADKRLVFGSWLNTPAGSIVNSILNQYLKAEGVTATASSIASGPTITEVIWNGKQISSAFTWLSQQAGYWWNIDNNGILWFQPYGGQAAPFVLDGTTVNIDDNLSCTFGNDMYVNRQFVKGAYAETGVLTENQHGDGAKRNFTLGYEIASTTTADLSITVDGVSQSIGTKGDTGEQFYVAIGDAVVAQDPSQPLLGSGDTISVTYKGRYPVLGLAQNTALINAQKTREGVGTGYVESEYSDTKVHTLLAADQIAVALLGHYGTDMTQLEFDMLASDGAGLVPGQLMTVNLSDFGLSNAQMLVSSVEITDSINDQFTIWYHVICIGSPIESSQWQTYWQNLMNQSADPTDLENVDDANGLAYFLTTTVNAYTSGVDSYQALIPMAIPSVLPPDLMPIVVGSSTFGVVTTRHDYSCPLCGNSTLCGNTTIIC